MNAILVRTLLTLAAAVFSGGAVANGVQSGNAQDQGVALLSALSLLFFNWAHISPPQQAYWRWVAGVLGAALTAFATGGGGQVAHLGTFWVGVLGGLGGALGGWAVSKPGDAARAAASSSAALLLVLSVSLAPVTACASTSIPAMRTAVEAVEADSPVIMELASSLYGQLQSIRQATIAQAASGQREEARAAFIARYQPAVLAFNELVKADDAYSKAVDDAGKSSDDPPDSKPVLAAWANFQRIATQLGLSVAGPPAELVRAGGSP